MRARAQRSLPPAIGHPFQRECRLLPNRCGAAGASDTVSIRGRNRGKFQIRKHRAPAFAKSSAGWPGKHQIPSSQLSTLAVVITICLRKNVPVNAQFFDKLFMAGILRQIKRPDFASTSPNSASTYLHPACTLAQVCGTRFKREMAGLVVTQILKHSRLNERKLEVKRGKNRPRETASARVISGGIKNWLSGPKIDRQPAEILLLAFWGNALGF